LDEQYVNLYCSVRLAGGLSSQEGNLQVLHKGVWGTVCANASYFKDADAGNVCSAIAFGYVL